VIEHRNIVYQTWSAEIASHFAAATPVMSLVALRHDTVASGYVEKFFSDCFCSDPLRMRYRFGRHMGTGNIEGQTTRASCCRESA
jgi:hypothetical protein